MKTTTSKKKSPHPFDTARVEYTIESPAGSYVDRGREMFAYEVERFIDKVRASGGYHFRVSYQH
jgi:hypothetical protein